MWRISEDRYKSTTLVWEKNTLQSERTGADLGLLEERVNYDGGEYILFTK
jgi:hypothetical protein